MKFKLIILSVLLINILSGENIEIPYFEFISKKGQLIKEEYKNAYMWGMVSKEGYALEIYAIKVENFKNDLHWYIQFKMVEIGFQDPKDEIYLTYNEFLDIKNLMDYSYKIFINIKEKEKEKLTYKYISKEGHKFEFIYDPLMKGRSCYKGNFEMDDKYAKFSFKNRNYDYNLPELKGLCGEFEVAKKTMEDWKNSLEN